MSDQKNVDLATNPEQDQREVIEVSWEDAEQVVALREVMQQTRINLSEMLLQHERAKRQMLTRLDSVEAEIYNIASSLQEKYSVNTEWTYEFKLPSAEGEKAYFIRKED